MPYFYLTKTTDSRIEMIFSTADSAEIKLNLIGRPANQSSTLVHPDCINSKCVASLAIDGNYNSNFAAGRCSHTNDPAGGSSWWRVDLGQPFKVQRVMIVNRGDGNGKLRSIFDPPADSEGTGENGAFCFFTWKIG